MNNESRTNMKNFRLINMGKGVILRLKRFSEKLFRKRFIISS